MLRNRLLLVLTNPVFLLTFILLAFFSKGVFLVVLQPLFTGQDEARHYNSVQVLAEPIDFSSQQRATPVLVEQEKDNLATYRFSEEIRQTATATDNHLLRSDIFNTIRFSDTVLGREEALIEAKSWSTLNYTNLKTEYYPDAVRSTIFYHQIVAFIESAFSDESILVRFHLIRLFSVILGTIAVLFAYLTARTIGFSTTVSLITTAIIAFQPRFSLYLSQINYDTLLIPLFFLFTYASARIIRDGFTPTNVFLLMGAIIPALFTKATGTLLIVMALALIIPYFWKKLHSLENTHFRHILLTSLTLISVGVVTYLYLHFFGSHLSFSQKISTLWVYLSKTLSFQGVFWPSETYWGTIGWTESWFIRFAPSFIFLIELAATLGLCLLFISRRMKSDAYPPFLPSKKQILFLILIIFTLQLGVRFADWHTYIEVGSMARSLGTPGRYFIPALLAHILLLSAGLGALLHYFGKARYFYFTLILILAFISCLTLHIIFNAILLRYYF